MRRRSPSALTAAVLLLIAAACGGGGPAPSEGGEPALLQRDAARRLELTMRDIEFGSDRLELVAAEIVSVRLVNAGELDHDFTLSVLPGAYGYRIEGRPPDRSDPGAYALRVGLRPGTSADLRLRIDAPGEYEFFCAVPGHRRAGMRGMIVVR